MKNTEIEKVAKELYEHMADHPQDGWENVGPDAHTFYRKIAKWHLRKQNPGGTQGDLFRDL